MAGGFQYRPEGIDALVAQFRDLQRQIDALRRTLTNPLVGNDSLSSPVETDAKNDVQSGFTWTTGFVARASVTFTVPDGFVTANVLALAGNGTTVADAPAGSLFLFTAAVIDGDGGASSEDSLMTSGGAVTVGAGWARKLTGLSGGDTITVQAWGGYTSASGGSVPESGSGNSRVSAIVTYTR